MRNQLGMTIKEFMIVLGIFCVPIAAFDLYELSNTIEEKKGFVATELKIVDDILSKFVETNKADLRTNKFATYMSCNDKKNSSKECVLDLKVLQKEKLISSQWTGSLKDYPDVKMIGTLTYTFNDIKSEVTLATSPDYWSKAQETLNRRIRKFINHEDDGLL